MTGPSPERTLRELASMQKLADDFGDLVERLAKEYDEAHDYSHRPHSGDLPGRGSGFRVTDPTGETVASWDQGRIRGAVRFVARKIRKMKQIGEEADQALHDAILDTDPDLKRDRLEKRRQAREAIEGMEA